VSCSIFKAVILKPASEILLRMGPMNPLETAPGLIMVNVKRPAIAF